jgi:hypothetical protein
VAKSTRSYFKFVPTSPSTARFFFFDEHDRESIDVAYREAAELASQLKRPASDISVWRMPAERGAWTPGRVFRGVAVIGEKRGQADPTRTLN